MDEVFLLTTEQELATPEVTFQLVITEIISGQLSLSLIIVHRHEEVNCCSGLFCIIRLTVAVKHGQVIVVKYCWHNLPLTWSSLRGSNLLSLLSSLRLHYDCLCRGLDILDLLECGLFKYCPYISFKSLNVVLCLYFFFYSFG